MKKHAVKLIGVLLALSLFFVYLPVSASAVQAEAPDDPEQTLTADIAAGSTDCDASISSEVDLRAYQAEEIISVVYRSETGSLPAYRIRQEGFTILSAVLSDGVLTLRVTVDGTSPALRTLSVSFGDDNSCDLFGYDTEIGTILSRSAEDDPDYLIATCLYKEGRMSEDAYRKAVHDLMVADGSITEVFSSDASTGDLRGDVAEPNAPVVGSSKINGQFNWKDIDGNVHPLGFTYVELYVDNALTSSAYTSASGSVSFTHTHPVDFTWYIRVYSRTRYIDVVDPGTNETTYRAETVSQSLAPRERGSITITYNYGATHDVLRAFQISQALTTGARYYEAMSGSAPAQIDAFFPATTTSNSYTYSQTSPHINILSTSFHEWDVMLHEYGHHISNLQGICTPRIGRGHSFNENLIHEYQDKVIGTRVAWNEGIATFFSILITQYFADYLGNLPYVGDAIYKNSRSDTGYNVETPTDPDIPFCEGCEYAILCTLYDMYDPHTTTEAWDRLSYTHERMFAMLTASKATNMGQFLTYYYTNVAAPYDGTLGSILEHYGLAPTITYCNISAATALPPVIIWTGVTSPAQYQFDRYDVYFYNANNNVILTKSGLTTTQYQLTPQEWTNLKNNAYGAITVVVRGTDVDYGVTTTNFYSSSHKFYI